MSLSTRVLPQMMIGTLTTRPNTTSPIWWPSWAFWAAPAMAMTLSRLMTKSATMIVLTAAAMDVPPLMLPWASSSGLSSLTPIHSSNRPPTTFRNGMASRVSAKAMSTTRRMMAPAVPHRMPCMRCLGARLRQASAMTTALSPPSRMSIRMIWNTAAQLSVWKNSSTLDPQGIFERRNGAGRAPARAARAQGTMAARCTAYYCSSALRQYFLTSQENFPQRQHHDRAERSRNKGQLVLCQAQRGIDAHHRLLQGGIADQQFARDK